MQEATSVRSELHSLQTQLAQRDAEVERKKVELDSTRRDKLSLEKLLREKQADIEDMQERLQSAGDKLISLTKSNTELDAKLHSVQALQSRAALNQSRLEQEKEILEKGNKWLYEELESKSQAFNTERRKATDTILDLQRKLSEVEGTAERLKAEHGRLSQQHETQRKAAEEAGAQLREVREESASKQENFEKELAMAHRMAQLYRESSEDRAKRCAELEGVVTELQTLMSSTEAAHLEALEKSDEARRGAEAKAEEEKSLRERVVAAAASASIPSAGTPGAPSPGGGDAGAGVSAALGATELYSKYIEVQEKWRGERLKNKQREIVMEELLLEVERRAALVKEQQEEYESVKASYARVSASMEELAAEKRRLEAVVNETQSTGRRGERERRALEQQLKDLGQQVARLLHEAQSAGTAARAAAGASQFSGGNASDLTTQLLVEFKDIEELQQQNQRLLRVNRELSQAAEATRAEAEEELRREYESQLARVSEELSDLRRNRESAEELLAQVVRQRDTLRQLLQGGDGDLNVARSAYARSLGGGAPSPAQGGAGAETSANGAASRADAAKYREMYSDLDGQFKQFREEASKNQTMLNQDVSFPRF